MDERQPGSPDAGRRLGVDPGSRRTGLALAEPGTAVALPHATLHHRGFEECVSQLLQVIASLDVDEVILGLPLRLDGSEGEAARRVRRLAARLREGGGYGVVLWDERLSTVAAERALSAAGVSGRKQRAVVDQAAATLLLQSYLDARGRGASL